MPRSRPPRPSEGLTMLQINAWIERRFGKRKRRRGGEPEREPVTPDRPRPLSGGAAAELEYDE